MYEYGIDFIEENEIERMIFEFLRKQKKKEMDKFGGEAEKAKEFEEGQEERQKEEYVSAD